MPNRSKTINTKTLIICVNSLICDLFFLLERTIKKNKLKTCVIAKNKLRLL